RRARLRRSGLGGERVLGDGRAGRERLGVANGQVGQDLAVDFDAGQDQAVDEVAVGQAVDPGRHVDEGDPETTEGALAVAAVAVGVDAGLELRFLGLLVRVVRTADVALGTLEGGAALLARAHGTLDAGHLLLPPRRRLTRGTSASVRIT